MIAVVDGLGVPVLREGDRFIVEEAHTYEVRGVEAVAWDDRDLPPRGGGFFFDVGHRVGRIDLEWRTGTVAGRVQIESRPRAEKLSPELWLQLVEDLETWLPTVSTGLDGARDGGVGTAGVSAGWLAEALLPLAPLLLAAVDDVLANLRVRGTSRLEDRPLRTARTVSRESLTWLGRHPAAAAWLDGWRASEMPGRPPDIPLRRSLDTVDNDANRYLRWLLDRVSHTLFDAAARLYAVIGDEAAWCAARASRLRGVGERINRRVALSPIAQLVPQPPGGAALSVVFDDPRYARVHALGRRFLSPRFSLAEEENPASVRPSFDLYELWTFLGLARAVEGALPFKWRREGVSLLLDPLGTGGGARLVGESGEGALLLAFNTTFASYHSGQRGCWSLSGERRPDLVLAWRPVSGPGAWVVLDAKYRIGRNLVDAFASVHIYRDALRWDGYGGAAKGGVLLAPAQTPDTAPYFSEAMRAEHGMRAFEVRPGVSFHSVLEWALGAVGCPVEANPHA